LADLISGYVITSFPQRTHHEEQVYGERGLDPEEASDVLNAILRHLRNPNRSPITSPEDLVELITSYCFNILSPGQGELPEVDFMRVFSVATNKAVSALKILTYSGATSNNLLFRSTTQ